MAAQQSQGILRRRSVHVIILIAIFAIAAIVIALTEPDTLTNILTSGCLFFGIVISLVGSIYPNLVEKIVFLLLGLCILGASIFLLLTSKFMITPILAVFLLLGLVVTVYISWRDRRNLKNNLTTTQRSLTTMESQLQTAEGNLTTVENRLQATQSTLTNVADKLKCTTELSKLAGQVLIFLSILLSEDDTDKRRRFMDALLSTSTRVFPEVYAASLYLPGPFDKEYIRIKESYNVPEENRKQAKCYIGSERQEKRGVAGEVFVKQLPLVAHFRKDPKDDTWKCDQESYLPFNMSTHPPFKSFACAPIIIAKESDNTRECLGVICFDSLSESAFDSPEVMDMLTVMARYIAAVLVILRMYDTDQTKT